jgi:hypothetical protein
MFVSFDSLPSNAKVWILQANRPFTTDQLNIVHERLRLFTEEWSVHGSPLPASYLVRFDQFIILAADETEQSASGCSIDSSVRVLKSLEQSFGIQLFDRNRVAFKTQDGVALIPLQELKQKFQDGILNRDTLTFNNLVDTRASFEKNWLVPAGDTWLQRYMANPLAKVKRVL